MFGTFGDIATDRGGQRGRGVLHPGQDRRDRRGPGDRPKLTPDDLYAKRPLCDDGYHEVFNRPNVEAVAIKENPIREVTANGVVTEDGDLHELDVLVFATGFDAVDGNYRRIEIRGRDGLHINDHWDGRPTSYLGVTTANFPNMVHGARPQRPLHEPSAEHRDPGRVDQRHNRFRRAQRRWKRSSRRRRPRPMDRRPAPRSPTRPCSPRRLVDLRREHPGQETQRPVLPGRPGRLPRPSSPTSPPTDTAASWCERPPRRRLTPQLRFPPATGELPWVNYTTIDPSTGERSRSTRRSRMPNWTTSSHAARRRTAPGAITPLDSAAPC